MAISSGDKLLKVITADGIETMIPVVVANKSGDRCILLETADGIKTPIKCSLMTKSGDRGILVKTADGILTPVIFDVIINKIYAGGDFTTAGGVSASYVASVENSVWSALSTGLNQTTSLVHCRSLGIDSTDNLYAGGAFSTAGGVSASNIAKWDGTSWSALGGGLGNSSSGYCYAIAIDSSDNVFAGGSFYYAETSTVVANIAKWNGTSWSALGSGLSGGRRRPDCYSLAFDSSENLYAGGRFTTAGGVTASRIAKWDGSSWSALGSGLGTAGDIDIQYCYAIAIDSSDNVFAGGDFLLAGGSSANRIAKWNGSSWSTLGSGLNGQCQAIAIDSSDNVFAGGSFTTAGGVTVNYIAKWDGSTWSALGSGLSGPCNAIYIDLEDNLYAGGAFSTAGGVSASSIAKWDGTSWEAIGSGLNGTCQALI